MKKTLSEITPTTCRVKKMTSDQALQKLQAAKARELVEAFGPKVQMPQESHREVDEYATPYPSRLYPRKDVWRDSPSAGKKPEPLPLGNPKFQAGEVHGISSRFLSSRRGHVLQWIGLNPCITITELARVVGRTRPGVMMDIQWLRQHGFILQYHCWAVHPDVSRRLFTPHQERTLEELLQQDKNET